MPKPRGRRDGDNANGRAGKPEQSSQPCIQCCVYQDQNYSEGAVIKVEGVVLQCQRDEKTISTNPLVWRRVKP